MIQENNKIKVYEVINNQLDEINEIKIPDNWWFSHNTYFLKKNKSLQIVDLKHKKERAFTSFPGWDIKNGDYFKSDLPVNTPLSKELRRKIELGAFIIILIVAGFVTWLISYLIARI